MLSRRGLKIQKMLRKGHWAKWFEMPSQSHVNRAACQPGIPWRRCITECALGVGSQLSGHAVCIITALSSAVAGGISTASDHGIWSALLVGTAIYAASVVVRFLLSRDNRQPSFKMAALGLALGMIVSAGIDKIRIYSHHLELTNWYQGLSEADRRQVRGKVRDWMEKQSASQRSSLEETAQLMGYDFAEDYVVINVCTPSINNLKFIWDAALAAN